MEAGLKQGPWRKAAYWLAPKAFFFFYTSQGHLHRSSTAHSRLGPLWLIINKENASQTYLQLSPNKVPSSQTSPVCIKLTKTNQSTQGDLKIQRHSQIDVHLVQPSATHPDQMGWGQCVPLEQLWLWRENLTQRVACGIWANKGPKPRCHLQISVFIQLSDSWHCWADGWVLSKPDLTGRGYPQPSRLFLLDETMWLMDTSVVRPAGLASCWESQGSLLLFSWLNLLGKWSRSSKRPIQRSWKETCVYISSSLVPRTRG